MNPSISIIKTNHLNPIKRHIDKKTNQLEVCGSSLTTVTRQHREVMPEIQHQHLPVDSTTPSQSTYLELPSQSPDTIFSHGSSHSPSPSNRRPEKRCKRVHWAASVVDNEHKMKSRGGSPPKLKTLTKTSAPPAQSEIQPSTPRPPTANTSMKMFPSSPGQPSIHIPVPSYRPGTPPYPQHSRTPTQGPSQIPANTSSKLNSSSPSHISHRIVSVDSPPVVLDPPRSSHPPPAPRPSRLPTPDLPEIEESKFFIPKEIILGYPRLLRHCMGKPTHLHHDKTDVQMPKAYMQKRKRGGV